MKTAVRIFLLASLALALGFTASNLACGSDDDDTTRGGGGSGDDTSADDDIGIPPTDDDAGDDDTADDDSADDDTADDDAVDDDAVDDDATDDDATDDDIVNCTPVLDPIDTSTCNAVCNAATVGAMVVCEMVDTTDFGEATTICMSYCTAECVNQGIVICFNQFAGDCQLLQNCIAAATGG